MENTDKIKNMITLIEKNNENYYDALSNLADTFDTSLSSALRVAINLELARREAVQTKEKQRNFSKNPITKINRLLSRKS